MEAVGNAAELEPTAIANGSFVALNSSLAVPPASILGAGLRPGEEAVQQRETGSDAAVNGELGFVDAPPTRRRGAA